MRYKLSFKKSDEQNSALPLHHQNLLAESIKAVSAGMQVDKASLNFSSLKGTSRVMNGLIRFLSTKISLSIASNNDSFATELVEKIMQLPALEVGEIKLIPKKSDIVMDPVFSSKMKYISISPLILRVEQGIANENNFVEPTSVDFSDELFHSLMDRMEKAGFTAAQLDDYQVFALTPDKEYLAKSSSSSRKIARLYSDTHGTEYLGYLFPFTLHAHPDVQKFVWDCGIGILNEEGYGMIDVAERQF